MFHPQPCRRKRLLEQIASRPFLIQTGDIQAIVTYKWSDNVIRTRVSTLRLEYLRENQIAELGKRFDEQAAAVMLARMVSRKTEVEDTL